MKPHQQYVNIIGAGIVGSVAARLVVMKTPFNVRLFDDPDKVPASHASGGVMNTSWLSGLPVEAHTLALQVYAYLRRKPVVSLPFKVVGKRVFDLQVVPPEGILVTAETRVSRIEYRPEAVRQAGAGWVMTAQRTWPGPTLLATGAWTGDLWAKAAPTLKQKAGVAFRLNTGTPLEEAKVKLWAPYRQVVAVPHAENVIWAGDGTALNPNDLDPDRIKASLARVRALVGASHRVLETRVGVRALITGQKHGACGPIMDRTWLAYGAHKNGWTLAPTWAMNWIKEAL